MVTSNSKLLKLLKPILFILCYSFVYLPILVLILFSFNASNNSHVWQGFSLMWYEKLFSSIDIIAAVKTSLIVAFTSTVISIFLGTMLVIASKWWLPRFMMPIFMPSVIAPEIIMAVGILSLFYFFKVPLGYNSLIAGHTILGLGYTVPILRSKFAKLDPILTEASLDLGAGYFETFKKVLFPLLAPAMIATAFLIFTLSLDDFFIAFFCSGQGMQTITTYVYSQIRAMPDPSLNAISTLLLLVSGIMLIILSMTKIAREIVENG